MKIKPNITVAEIVDILGIAKEAVRLHLIKLINEGIVEKTSDDSQGHRYSLKTPDIVSLDDEKMELADLKTPLGPEDRTFIDKVSEPYIKLGDFTYVSELCNINNARIGKFCSIGYSVKCGLGIHPSKTYVSTHPVFYSIKKQCGVTFVKEGKFKEHETVEIGNDVWVGACSIILDGVKISDGAIVAAGSVVASDVPSYAVVGGVPAKIIRYRFDEKTIDRLNLLKWWDKDINWIRDRSDLFCDINEFLEKTESHKKF